MTVPELFSEKDEATGEATGTWSTGRVLAWVFAAQEVALFNAWLLGYGPGFTFWQMILGCTALGIIAVGFYRGLGATAFSEMAGAIADRFRREP